MAEIFTLGLRSGVVHLAPPNPEWANVFIEERTRIASSLGELPMTIEHIGSTAVATLFAKPILDVMVGRPSNTEVAPYVKGLVAAGYDYRGENGLIGREYFVRDSANGLRTHHLHLVERDGEIWNSHLAFRDYLRGNSERAAAYVALKRELAAQFPADRDAYTDGKAAFIADTLRLYYAEKVIR